MRWCERMFSCVLSFALGDATVRVWDIATGECLQIMTDHSLSVLHLKFHGSKLVTCSKDRMVRQSLRHLLTNT